MSKITLYSKIIVNLILAVLVVLGIWFFVPRLLGFFLPFVIGWIIAMICNPLVKFLERRLKIVRKFSSVLIIIAVLGGVILLIYVIGAKLIEQAASFIGDLDKMYTNFDTAVKNLAEDLGERYQLLPQKITTGLQNFLYHLDDYVKELVNKVELPSISTASDAVKAVGNAFFMFIITILSSYFFIAEKDHMVERFKSVMPVTVREQFNVITSNFKMAMGGYFKAQFKIMIIIMIILYIGFMCMKVEYALLLAFAIAFLDFLPVFGTGAVIWPWALIDVVNGAYSNALILFILYLVCQAVKQVLQPKMVGDSIGLSPIMTLVFLYIGYKVAGIIGVIVGIPVGMLLVNLYRSGAFDMLLRGMKILLHDINEYRKY